jgi:hypothetical protein
MSATPLSPSHDAAFLRALDVPIDSMPSHDAILQRQFAAETIDSIERLDHISALNSSPLGRRVYRRLPLLDPPASVREVWATISGNLVRISRAAGGDYRGGLGSSEAPVRVEEEEGDDAGADEAKPPIIPLRNPSRRLQLHQHQRTMATRRVGAAITTPREALP